MMNSSTPLAEYKREASYKRKVCHWTTSVWPTREGKWLFVIGLLMLSLFACSSHEASLESAKLDSTSSPQQNISVTSKLQTISLPSPQQEAMQAVERHCQLVDLSASFPVYCQFQQQQENYHLALSFSHYDSSQYYLMTLSHGLILPYCQAVLLHQVKGHVSVTIFATQIQRRYDCNTQNWADWQPISTPVESPFIEFVSQCQRWEKAHKDIFHCNIDWYQQTPILVFTFPDMQPATDLNAGQSGRFIQSFCQSGMKEFGEALYLVEVPSFNLAKVVHCGAEIETEWFAIEPDESMSAPNNLI
ncbi:hypothetical protein [Vibrio gangliei]|uniref:hypothetical protein n=1 Tax=Vibrio gangliei TaxID=2077090 RepID=UPI000D01FDEE|nr:hypothetical protein [Vibrio gangliei]